MENNESMEDIRLTEEMCLRELKSAFFDKSSEWRRANARSLTYLAEELEKIDIGYRFLKSSLGILKEPENYRPL